MVWVCIEVRCDDVWCGSIYMYPCCVLMLLLASAVAVARLFHRLRQPRASAKTRRSFLRGMTDTRSMSSSLSSFYRHRQPNCNNSAHTHAHCTHTRTRAYTRARARGAMYALCSWYCWCCCCCCSHTHTLVDALLYYVDVVYISTRSKFAHRNTNTPRTAPFFVG